MFDQKTSSDNWWKSGNGWDSWDSWGDQWQNWSGGAARPVWRISRKNTEGLFKFDGELANFQSWKNRIRDHASEEWPAWREILDHAERVDRVLTLEELATFDIQGVNAAQISSDLWSFLLRWIGPKLYLRRTKMSPGIEGNGLELWRKLFSEYQGSDELVRMAGRAKLLDF